MEKNMEFIEFALEKERKTIESYRALAEKCQSHEGVKNILLMLADDHEKHSDTLMEMQNSASVEMEGAEVFREARRMFSDMQKDKNPFSCDINQVKLYEGARELVLKKHQFYLDVAEKMENEESKVIVIKMAEEEKKQAVVLENIIEMVRRPETWLEDAEFHHLDEY
jgi:rubrerythrin